KTSRTHHRRCRLRNAKARRDQTEQKPSRTTLSTNNGGRMQASGPRCLYPRADGNTRMEDMCRVGRGKAVDIAVSGTNPSANGVCGALVDLAPVPQEALFNAVKSEVAVLAHEGVHQTSALLVVHDLA